MFQYCGAIHIHSLFSDGTGDLKTIVKAAKKAGLDWVIITDHNTMEAEEGIFDGVYVIRGEEISPHSENHYLALGINEVIEPCDNPQVYVDKVRKLGGFGFSAHPDEGFTTDNNGNPVPRRNSRPPFRSNSKPHRPRRLTELPSFSGTWLPHTRYSPCGYAQQNLPCFHDANQQY